MRRMLLVVLLASVAACQPGKGTSGRVGDEYVAAPNADGKTVVLILDVSKSMDFNDRERFNEQGAQLAVVLGSDADNIGGVTFSSDARVVARLNALTDRPTRSVFQGQLSNLQRDGQTNYVAALREAATMLERANAPRDAVTLFLTDGEHTVGGTSEEVLNGITPFIQHGWKVYCIGLGAEAQSSQLLKEIAVRSEGAYFPAVTPEELMSAFVKILSQTFSLISVDGGIKPFQVDAGVKRLIYLMIKGSRETTLGKLTNNGGALDVAADPSIYRYPTRTNPHGQIEAIHVNKPPAGLMEMEITGPAKVSQILWQPDFTLELDEGFPAGEYYEGETIEFSMRVRGNEAILDKVRKGGSATVEIKNDKGEKVAEMTLTKNADGDVRFTGKMPVPEQKGVMQGVMKFTLKDDTGATWEHEKRATIRVNAGARPVTIEITPTSIDFGTRWNAGEAATQEVTVTMKGTTGADMSVLSSSPSVQVSPESFKLGPGETKKFTVTVKADQGGSFSESVTLTGSSGGGNRVSAPPVPVKWKVLAITGPASIPPVAVQQGKEFKIPLEHTLAGGGDLKVELDDPAGPGGAKIETKIIEEGGKKYIVGKVPGDAASGDYKGAVKLSVPGETAPPRSVPFTLGIGEATPVVGLTTKEISITTAKSDWTEWHKVQFDFEFVRGATVAMKFTDLKGAKGGVIDGKYRQGFKGADGWDGKKLDAKGSYTGEYRARISNDLAPDTYTGKLLIEVNDGGKVHTSEIPVKVVYKPE